MTKTTRKRILLWGTIGFGLLVVLALAIRPKPVASDFGRVDRGPLTVTLDHEGVTRVRDRFVVSAPVSGRVLRIELEPGDAVVAGVTVLARFLPASPVPIDARTRAESRARVRVAQAALERARAERARAAAEFDLAEVEWSRVRRLAEEGVASKQERDAAEGAAKVRARGVEAADAAAAAALHDLEAANAALIEPVAPGSPGAGALALRSPIDGVVLRRLRESEAVVGAGEPLLEVADPSGLEIVADYLSTDAVRMRPGLPVLVEQWGGARPLRGRVRRVEPSGFMKVSALGVEEQRVWVVIDITDPYDQWKALGDGYRVETRVVIWEQADALRVPTSALFRHGTGWAVFVVDGGVARLRPVGIGERNGTAASVTAGLAAGASVVLHPPAAVADGVKVVLRQ